MLTVRQHDALTIICGRIASGKPAPSMAEIGEAIGVSSRGFVHALVHGLEARGFVRMTYGRQRSITPLKWPDGSDFDPAAEVKIESLIRAYGDGRTAARLGQPPEPVNATGEAGVAWKLGYKSVVQKQKEERG